jgi:hypothetical protein
VYTSKILAFWDAMSCRQVYRYQCFGVAGCLHAQGSPRSVTWTFVHIYQYTRQLTGLASSSATLQEPQIAHTHPYLFTDTNCAWIPRSHNLYVSLTDLCLPFESILAITIGPQNANIHTYTQLNSNDSAPRLWGNVTERYLDTELHYSKICLKLKVN